MNFLKYLNITRPVISYDLETTGVDVKKDKIVSISAHKFFPDGTVETKYKLINPKRPIPESSTAIHGITDEMVKDQPSFDQISKSLHSWFLDCDVMGFNLFDYDIPLLGREFYECGIVWNYGFVIDVFKMEQKRNRHTLSETYKRYMGESFEGAHNAEADNIATQKIFYKMMEIDNTIPPNVEEIHNMVFSEAKKYADFGRCFYYDASGRLTWNMNPKKDEPVDPRDKLCSWFLDPNKDFPKQSKDILIDFINKSNQ